MEDQLAVAEQEDVKETNPEAPSSVINSPNGLLKFLAAEFDGGASVVEVKLSPVEGRSVHRNLFMLAMNLGHGRSAANVAQAIMDYSPIVQGAQFMNEEAQDKFPEILKSAETIVVTPDTELGCDIDGNRVSDGMFIHVFNYPNADDVALLENEVGTILPTAEHPKAVRVLLNEAIVS